MHTLPLDFHALSFSCPDPDDDDYKERTIPLNETISKILRLLQSLCLPSFKPEDSPIIGKRNLGTILKRIDKFIKSSVEDLVLILSESEDTFASDGECDLSSCDDFSPINIPEGESVTFSNPLFDSNDDFTSSDDESLSDEDVPDDNVTPLSDANEDECFNPGGEIDEIDAFLEIDISTDMRTVITIRREI
ncbi:hypothetical protein Tco_0660167 [Tanacetum coccineum]